MGGKSRKSGGGVSSRLIAQLKYGNYQANETAPAGSDKKQRKGERRYEEKPSTGGFGLLDE